LKIDLFRFDKGGFAPDGGIVLAACASAVGARVQSPRAPALFD
jgi:hypothetical protein